MLPSITYSIKKRKGYWPFTSFFAPSHPRPANSPKDVPQTPFPLKNGASLTREMRFYLANRPSFVSPVWKTPFLANRPSIFLSGLLDFLMYATGRPTDVHFLPVRGSLSSPRRQDPRPRTSLRFSVPTKQFTNFYLLSIHVWWRYIDRPSSLM